MNTVKSKAKSTLKSSVTKIPPPTINAEKFIQRLCQRCSTSIAERKSIALYCDPCTKQQNIENQVRYRKNNPVKYRVTQIRHYLRFMEKYPEETKQAKLQLQQHSRSKQPAKVS